MERPVNMIDTLESRMLAYSPYIDMQTIEFEFKDEVIKISLNRPHEFNALNEQMLDELTRILENIRNDRGAKAVVLTGAGQAFCYGLDFQEIQSLSEGERTVRLPVMLKKFQTLIYTIATLDRSVVAALKGFATGAGLDLALACDFRVASDGAKLSSAHIKMGLIPDGGGTYFLPRMVGYGRAMELIMRGTVLTSAEAKDLGLVTSIAPDNRLLEEAISLAKDLASGPTRAVALIKAAMFKNISGNLEHALTLEGQSQLQCFATKDHAEALSALKERRKPRFQGC